MSALRCHICERPCLYEVEPAFGSLPAEFVDDVWTVAMRNHIYVDACHSCWMAWPDEHKVLPPEGFGRSKQRVDELVGVLQETAP